VEEASSLQPPPPSPPPQEQSAKSNKKNQTTSTTTTTTSKLARDSTARKASASQARTQANWPARSTSRRPASGTSAITSSASTCPAGPKFRPPRARRQEARARRQQRQQQQQQRRQRAATRLQVGQHEERARKVGPVQQAIDEQAPQKRFKCEPSPGASGSRRTRSGGRTVSVLSELVSGELGAGRAKWAPTWPGRPLGAAHCLGAARSPIESRPTLESRQFVANSKLCSGSLGFGGRGADFRCCRCCRCRRRRRRRYCRYWRRLASKQLSLLPLPGQVATRAPAAAT